MSDKHPSPNWNRTTSLPPSWIKEEQTAKIEITEATKDCSKNICESDNNSNLKPKEISKQKSNSEAKHIIEEEITDSKKTNEDDLNLKPVLQRNVVKQREDEEQHTKVKSRSFSENKSKANRLLDKVIIVLLLVLVVLLAVLCVFAFLHYFTEKSKENVDDMIAENQVSSLVSTEVVDNSSTNQITSKLEVSNDSTDLLSNNTSEVSESYSKTEHENADSESKVTSNYQSNDVDFEPYVIDVVPNTIVYKEPYFISDIVQVIEEGGKYTIVEETWGAGGTFGLWGKLKSGVGWINIYEATFSDYNTSTVSSDYTYNYNSEYEDTSNGVRIEESDITESDTLNINDINTIETSTITVNEMQFEYPTLYQQGTTIFIIDSFKADVEKNEYYNNVTFGISGSLTCENMGTGYICYEAYDSEGYLIDSHRFLKQTLSRNVSDFKFKESISFDKDVSYVYIYVEF